MRRIICYVTLSLRGEHMGAIAVSREDEGQIGELMRELGVKSKAQVVRAALRTLRERLDQEKLRSQIRESVRRCAEADRRENRLLAPGGVPPSEPRGRTAGWDWGSPSSSRSSRPTGGRSPSRAPRARARRFGSGCAPPYPASPLRSIRFAPRFSQQRRGAPTVALGEPGSGGGGPRSKRGRPRWCQNQKLPSPLIPSPAKGVA